MIWILFWLQIYCAVMWFRTKDDDWLFYQRIVFGGVVLIAIINIWSV